MVECTACVAILMLATGMAAQIIIGLKRVSFQARRESEISLHLERIAQQIQSLPLSNVPTEQTEAQAFLDRIKESLNTSGCLLGDNFVVDVDSTFDNLEEQQRVRIDVVLKTRGATQMERELTLWRILP